MIWLIDLGLFVWLFVVWSSIEKKWNKVYITQKPSKYWNHVYIHPDDDASVGIQNAVDFLAKRQSGGIAHLSGGIYNIKDGLTLRGRVTVEGERG